MNFYPEQDSNGHVPKHTESRNDPLRLPLSNSPVNEAAPQSPASSHPSPLILQPIDDDVYLTAQDLLTNSYMEDRNSDHLNAQLKVQNEPAPENHQIIRTTEYYFQLALQDLSTYALSANRTLIETGPLSPIDSYNPPNPGWSLDQVPFGSQLFPGVTNQI